MKRFLILAMAVFCVVWSAYAENIIIGEQLPDMRIKSWLMDFQPEEADYTCILFHHSESPLCDRQVRRIKRLISNHTPECNIVIITKEEYADAGVTLTEHLADNTAIAFDEKGRTFRAFGVKFIPFCVICDDHQEALWCGNGATLTKQIIEQILTTKTK